MADPFVFANSQVLNDGISCRARWKHAKGLWHASMRLPSQQVDAMARKIQMHPGTLGYAPRKLNWSGRLINQGSFFAGRQQLALMASRMATRPTRLQIGSLYLEVDFSDLVPKEDDKYNLLPNEVSFDMAGDAPGLWKGAYQFAQGLAEGITVSDDRIDQTGYLVSVAAGAGAQAFFTFNNPGDAPCEAVFSFSLRDYPSTTIHVQNQSQDAPRAIVYTTDAHGNGRLDERHGLILMPGPNVIYIQSSTGSLLSVATSGLQGSFYGTVFRWTGNEGNRFDDSPLIFVPFRSGPASYVDEAGNLAAISVDASARVNSQGLVLEAAGTNICQSPEDLTNTSYWNPGAGSVANNGTTLPTGKSGAVSVYTQASGSYITQTINCSANTVYTMTWFAKSYPNTAFQAHFSDNGGGSGAYPIYSSTGSWQRFNLQYTTSAGATTMTIGFGFGGMPNGNSIFIWGVQVESSPLASSYIKVARGADVVALWARQNYVASSRAFEFWSAAGTSAAIPTVNASQPASDGIYQLRTWTSGGSGNTLTSPLITPDVLPRSTPWTVRISAWLGTASGNYTLALLDQNGGVLGSTTFATSSINAPELSGSAKTSFALTVPETAISSAVSGFKIQLTAPSAGTILLEDVGLTQGSFPGVSVYTYGSPIMRPSNVLEWPAGQWTQNGSLTATIVPPPQTTGLTYALLGEISIQTIALYRDAASGATSNNVLILRRGNDGVHYSGYIVSPTFWDGKAHTVRTWWVNYSIGSDQYMYIGLDVDGTNVYTSGNQIIGGTTTSWSSGERLWLSGDNTIATLSDVVIGFPTDKIPAGATLPAV